MKRPAYLNKSITCRISFGRSNWCNEFPDTLWQKYITDERKLKMNRKIFITLLMLSTIFIIVSCKDNNKLSETKNDTADTLYSTDTQESKSEITSVPNYLNVEGVWYASGKEDEIGSTWEFADGILRVNQQDYYNYSIDKIVDKNGYSVVTITAEDGNSHGLLLKQTEYGMDGITVEGLDYEEYLKSETLPVTYQIIEYRAGELLAINWGNMDEAIDFYESTFKNSENNVDIIWENYQRDLWSILDSDSSGNVMVLHFSNIGGAGGSYTKFIRYKKETEIIEYPGNATYPNNPSKKYTVRNSDYKILSEEYY